MALTNLPMISGRTLAAIEARGPDMGEAIGKALPQSPYWVRRVVDGLFQDRDMAANRDRVLPLIGYPHYAGAAFDKLTWAQKFEAAQAAAFWLMAPENEGALDYMITAEKADTETRRAEERMESVMPIVIGGGVLGAAVAGAAISGAQAEAAEAQGALESLTQELAQAKASPAQAVDRRRSVMVLAVAAAVIAVIYFVR